MPKIALFGATAVFAAIALILAALYVFDTDVILGGSLFRAVNLLAAAILFALMAVWMLIASLDFRGAELTVSKEREA
jgi:formate hydrogenlyase subunit 4